MLEETAVERVYEVSKGSIVELFAFLRARDSYGGARGRRQGETWAGWRHVASRVGRRLDSQSRATSTRQYCPAGGLDGGYRND